MHYICGMQDAQDIDNIKLEVRGEMVEKTKTFVTQTGEVFIGLLVRGSWLNVRATELKKYVSPNETFVRLNNK